MFKISIHIENNETACDSQVKVLVELPQVPQKGDIINLDEEIFEKLELQARKSLTIAQRYAPNWFYRESFGEGDITEKDLKNLTFIDAFVVTGVFYTPNQDMVAIEISDEITD